MSRKDLVLATASKDLPQVEIIDQTGGLGNGIRGRRWQGEYSWSMGNGQLFIVNANGLGNGVRRWEMDDSLRS